MNKINKSFFKDVREILSRARIQAYAAVNSAMVEAYWLIGKRIVEEEQQGSERAAYGEKLLQALSNELSAEFGKGFSYANLRNFRQFYLTYPNPEICYALCSRLCWTHQRLFMNFFCVPIYVNHTESYIPQPQIYNNNIIPSGFFAKKLRNIDGE